VGGRYSDEWHRAHLIAPRDLVPESNMPAYPWLAKTNLDPERIVLHLKALKRLGDPYSDAQIANAPEELAGKTELDALVAYLQGMGIQIKSRR
jgi:cytochrome c oxidase cbb3-type subunit 2